ncbi:MAG: hypothetical protein COV74_00730 [Candidatus Omnitrophica bacterium CG11_big_fil_rev_8_21_14_0_20_45_26]|uniref:Uncharacterized protein n=1 Tax=Candidatus Abzuiibacterium crystallinum TaxID=1974748 RepID=A0A2H0LSM5_9BACT|nr:MAG: hypothetical protein COV74_00730 [Candidatus Omnitrophica bacterium CG11_big_fil_rev_8_21_14_0_20_45_26]
MNKITKGFLLTTIILVGCFRSTPTAELQLILQQLVDLQELQQYYHADVLPDRKPLVIVKNALIPNGLHLVKFDTPVRILSMREINDDKSIKSFVEITKLEIKQKTCLTTFKYPSEGLLIRAKLIKKDGEWIIVEKELTER